jgi:two-component system sensor histidine kinase YesM
MAGLMDRLFARLRAGSSIAFRIRFSFAVLMALLLVPAVVSSVMMTQYALRYHSLIQQVNRVAALKPTVRSYVTDELWDVVAGNKPFSEGRQYAIVAYVNGQIESFMRTSSESDKELIAARRAMDTITD